MSRYLHCSIKKIRPYCLTFIIYFYICCALQIKELLEINYDKKNITCLIIICSYILQICNGILGFSERKKDMNRMDIPKNPSDFFLLRYFVKPLLLSRVSMIILIIYVFFLINILRKGISELESKSNSNDSNIWVSCVCIQESHLL